MKNNPGYYETLSNYPSYIPSPFEGQIDVDLRRTFPEDPFFKDENIIYIEISFFYINNQVTDTHMYIMTYTFVIIQWFYFLNNFIEKNTLQNFYLNFFFPNEKA